MVESHINERERIRERMISMPCCSDQSDEQIEDLVIQIVPY